MMSRRAGILSRALLLFLGVGGCAGKGDPPVTPPPSGPGTLHVPLDCATIQAAIDRAGVGDTILVAPGRYTGSGNRDLDFRGKDLVLLGEGGADSCVIVCGIIGEFHRGFRLRRKETRATLIEGFTITGGNPESESGPGGAIACSLASPETSEVPSRCASSAPPTGPLRRLRTQ